MRRVAVASYAYGPEREPSLVFAIPIDAAGSISTILDDFIRLTQVVYALVDVSPT